MLEEYRLITDEIGFAVSLSDFVMGIVGKVRLLLRLSIVVTSASDA